MKTIMAVIVLMSLTSLPLAAQPDPDYQLRVLAHIQLPSTNGLGMAGWLIMPDLTKNEPTKLLTVAGWLIKREENWQEFMAGALLGTDGSIQPALNLRSYAVYAKAKRLDFYGELTLRPDRGIASAYSTYPLGRFRLGLETELTAGLEAETKSDAKLGPRLSFKVPNVERLTIATGVMFGLKGETVIRTYLLYSFF